MASAVRVVFDAASSANQRSAAQAAAHGAPHLATDPDSDAGAEGGRIDNSSIRGSAHARARGVSTHDLCAKGLWPGTGSPGGLVRSLGGVKRRAGQAAGLFDA